jgi:hypothetical protein
MMSDRIKTGGQYAARPEIVRPVRLLAEANLLHEVGIVPEQSLMVYLGVCPVQAAATQAGEIAVPWPAP